MGLDIMYSNMCCMKVIWLTVMKCHLFAIQKVTYYKCSDQLKTDKPANCTAMKILTFI